MKLNLENSSPKLAALKITVIGPQGLNYKTRDICQIINNMQATLSNIELNNMEIIN